jgi:hypothetical protein
MKKFIGFIIFIGSLMMIINGCTLGQNKQDFPAISPEAVQLTVGVTNFNQVKPTHDFSFDDSRAACQASSDCVLMPVGGCGNIQGIHLSQIDIANSYTEKSKKENPNVQCAPQLPDEEYQAICLNQKCRAMVTDAHLLLEFPDQPVAGLPFWIGMNFRYPTAIEQLDAHFVLPEDMKFVGGQTSWDGPVEAGKDYVLWVQVQTDKIGDRYVSGWSGSKQNDNAIPPLYWSEYIYISSPLAITPWPEREHLIPTPGK